MTYTALGLVQHDEHTFTIVAQVKKGVYIKQNISFEVAAGVLLGVFKIKEDALIEAMQELKDGLIAEFGMRGNFMFVTDCMKRTA